MYENKTLKINLQLYQFCINISTFMSLQYTLVQSAYRTTQL